MLARQDLIKLWRSGKLCFDPNILIDQINLSSIDLRLGFTFAKHRTQPGVVIRPAQDFDPSQLVENYELSGADDVFRLKPKEFRLGRTLETVSLPATVAAHVHGRSSLARAGLSVHATAPHIHPGFSGPIVLEFFNSADWELEFFPGRDMVCQISLWEVKTPPPLTAIKSLSTYRGQKIPFPPRKRG